MVVTIVRAVYLFDVAARSNYSSSCSLALAHLSIIAKYPLFAVR